MISAEIILEELLNRALLKNFLSLFFPCGLSEDEKALSLRSFVERDPACAGIDADKLAAALSFMEQSYRRSRKFYTLLSPAGKESPHEGALFFLRGTLKAPCAFICPRGNCTVQGTLLDAACWGFELARRGVNTFIISCRPGLDSACEDLARGISWAAAHAQPLKINPLCYSIWGSSEGARAAAYVGSYGTRAFGGASGVPRAGVLILQNANHSNRTRMEPPTFVCAGSEDTVYNVAVMQDRVRDLKEFGIDAEIALFPGVSGDFSLGTGTPAQGWFRQAMAFWKKHMPGEARLLVKITA